MSLRIVLEYDSEVGVFAAFCPDQPGYACIDDSGIWMQEHSATSQSMLTEAD